MSHPCGCGVWYTFGYTLLRATAASKRPKTQEPRSFPFLAISLPIRSPVKAAATSSSFASTLTRLRFTFHKSFQPTLLAKLILIVDHYYTLAARALGQFNLLSACIWYGLGSVWQHNVRVYDAMYNSNSMQADSMRRVYQVCSFELDVVLLTSTITSGLDWT